MITTKSPPPLPFVKKAAQRTYPILSVDKAMDIIAAHCGDDVCIAEKHGSGKHKVIILPDAAQQFGAMIGYGRKSPVNACEQVYNGYGHIYKNPDEDSWLIIVKAFIEIKTTNRSAVSASAGFSADGKPNPGLEFLEYDHMMLEKYERSRNSDADGNMIDPFLKDNMPSTYVLFGHTHPDLGCTFSKTDLKTGRAKAAADIPVVMFVADPVRREMKAVIGKSFEDAEVFVYGRGAKTPAAEAKIGAEEIVRLASAFLQKKGVRGKVRMGSPFGRKTINIKLSFK